MAENKGHNSADRYQGVKGFMKFIYRYLTIIIILHIIISKAHVIVAYAEEDTIPVSTPVQNDLPETLITMSQFDYVGDSVTGISKKKQSVATLQKKVNKYGTLYFEGMPYNEYKHAMEYQWTDCTVYNKEPVNLTIDITKTMDYNKYVNTLKKLSRYEGVYLYKIGESTEGRDLYAVEIDLCSDNNKKVIMLTGQIHAREFAGGTFLVKQLVDLVQKAQTDKKVMKMLKSYKFVAVPIINVDGREVLIKEPKKWTRDDMLWKAYVNGTDGNRNFPGVKWGQVLKGDKLDRSIRKKPGIDNYSGKYAGSNSETKALMKWIYHYVVVEQAVCLLDMHQQGSIIYAGKTWSYKEQEDSSIDLSKKIFKLLNKGNSRKYTVPYAPAPNEGLTGTGSTLTDYAASVAYGAKFSPAMGFCAFVLNNKEYMLLQINDLDNIEEEIEQPNPQFRTLTVEIGLGSSYLGNSINTRTRLAKEYTKYNFDKLLESLPAMLD